MPISSTSKGTAFTSPTIPQLVVSGTTYILALSDAGSVIETTSASPTTITVPSDTEVPFRVGTIVGIRQYGAGAVTVAASTGVQIRSRASAYKTAGTYAEASLTKRADNEWILSGDLIA